MSKPKFALESLLGKPKRRQLCKAWVNPTEQCGAERSTVMHGEEEGQHPFMPNERSWRQWAVKKLRDDEREQREIEEAELLDAELFEEEMMQSNTRDQGEVAT